MDELGDLGKTVTYRLELPGGQGRLKEASIFIMEIARDFEYFGLVKLNKILWRADFSSFLERHFPVTGRPYQKLEHGPAPVEMKPVLREMETNGWIAYVASSVPNERRPVPLSPPRLGNLSPRELSYLSGAAEHYREMTAAETSKDSHGVAWQTREIGSLIPYDAAIFDDQPLPQELEHKLAWLGRDRHWRSAQLRSIISTHEFDRQVEDLGGAKAIDDALAPFIEALTKDPHGFPLFENDFTSFRYVRTREVTMTPALVIVFTIDENKNVVLEHIEALP